jgi:RND family efflux transporter MFP subunit
MTCGRQLAEGRMWEMSRDFGARPPLQVAVPVAFVLWCAACQAEVEAPAPVRPARVIVVEPAAKSADVGFAGHIEAQDQASLSFRLGGRLVERPARVGVSVGDGEVVARLDPENELNELRSARAALAAVQGVLAQADNQYQRQRQLVERGITTRADFEAAEQARTAAQAQVDGAGARVRTAEDIVGFTTLKADAPGVVTAVGAEPGEVVAAGRMIVQLARRDGRDAVFEIPADLARAATPDVEVVVGLASDPNVKAHGRVREIAPQADPVTRTFAIRVGLTNPPQSFRLGTAVSGTLRGSAQTALAIPSTALVRRGQDTGVWAVDPGTTKVIWRTLDVISAGPATALVAKGIAVGDIVVTAGANLLHEGQSVMLPGMEPQ